MSQMTQHPSFYLQLNGSLSFDELDKSLSYIEKNSSPTYTDITLMISDLPPMKFSIQHKNVEITTDLSTAIFRGNTILSIISAVKIFLFFNKNRYELKETDYTIRKTISELMDKSLFETLKEFLCFSRYTLYDINQGDGPSQMKKFIKSLGGYSIVYPQILRDGDKVGMIPERLIFDSPKIFVYMLNRDFPKGVSNGISQHEFLDYINTNIKGRRIIFRFCQIGDKVNDHPMYFGAKLEIRDKMEIKLQL